MTTTTKTPIVLIHGLWMTPKSWDTWAERFRAAGHQVIVPGWPGIDDRTVEDIRSNPEALKGIGLKQIADNYERIIRDLPEKPIIIGHSFGGRASPRCSPTAASASPTSASRPGQTAGVTALPLSTLWTGTPILSNPFGRNGAKPLSKRHFHFTFGNDLSREAVRRLWEEYAVNSYNRVFFEGVALGAQREGRRRPTSTSPAPTAPRCSSSPARSTTSCRRPSASAIVKKYRSTGSPAIVDYKSTRAARTASSARTAGRRSPTTRSPGRSSTPSPRQPRAERPADPKGRGAHAPRPSSCRVS